MKRKQYPKPIANKLEGFNIWAVLFLSIAVAIRLVQGFKYAPILFAATAVAMMIMKKRYRHEVDSKGYIWKKYKVIALTAIKKRQRKPSGFVALSLDPEEPFGRFHFAITSDERYPEPGTVVDVCVPLNMPGEKIGNTFYVLEYYGFRRPDN